jgi:signal transduction histidine kinase
VETAAARATSLVRALSDARSIERRSLALDLRPVDFATIVTPIAEMLDSTSDRHPIALSVEDAPLMVNGDANHLGRVVENMIANAIKYSPGGGAIEIELRRDGGDVVLSIRDHGIGIPAEERDLVFTLGYRARQAAGVAPGLGIGLYTSAEVIRQHGGTIQVTAPLGEGVQFVIRLPRTGLPAASRPRMGWHRPPSSRTHVRVGST